VIIKAFAGFRCPGQLRFVSSISIPPSTANWEEIAAMEDIAEETDNAPCKCSFVMVFFGFSMPPEIESRR
jgi:hypothetical protein